MCAVVAGYITGAVEIDKAEQTVGVSGGGTDLCPMNQIGGCLNIGNYSGCFFDRR